MLPYLEKFIQLQLFNLKDVKFTPTFYLYLEMMNSVDLKLLNLVRG